MKKFLVVFFVIVSVLPVHATQNLKWNKDQILHWEKDPRGGIDITLAPIKPSNVAPQCMEFWHGDAGLPLGPFGNYFRRDRCS
jgi:hypothetical protein